MLPKALLLLLMHPPEVWNNGGGSKEAPGVCPTLRWPLRGLNTMLSGLLGVRGLATTLPASSAAAPPCEGGGASGEPPIDVPLLLPAAGAAGATPAGVPGKLRLRTLPKMLPEALAGPPVIGELVRLGEGPLDSRSTCISCRASSLVVLPALPAGTSGAAASPASPACCWPLLPRGLLHDPVNMAPVPVSDTLIGALGLGLHTIKEQPIQSTRASPCYCVPHE